jgi:cell division septation protein DedD
MYNLGKCKYAVCYHDGIKQHQDKSRFFDIAAFKNKVKLNKFIDNLKSNGYEVMD